MTNRQLPLPIEANETKTVAWGVPVKDGKHEPFFIPRGSVGPQDIKFDLLYSGICHTDVHAGSNDWGNAVYPLVAGHELFGRVTQIGDDVTKFKQGDLIGVGCIVDSCRNCQSCKDGDENYCDEGMTWTYGSERKHGRIPGNKELPTYGGYSEAHVVHEKYAVKVPEGIPHENIGPILCAGVTMYSPLKHFGGLEGNKTIGIIGIGGLGTIGIKIAAATGQRVVAISSSWKKEKAALEKGATDYCVSTDEESMKKYASSCDLILNTVGSKHELTTYLPLLKKNGNLVQLGGSVDNHTLMNFQLMLRRISVSGSLIGGIADTEETLEFCAKHKIWPDVEVIEAKQIDEAWDNLKNGNSDSVRYVIDIKKSLQNQDFLPT